MRVAVLGSGSWGTALAKVLAENKHETTLWGIEPEVIESINMHQENERYLPEAKLPSELEATLDLSQAIRRVELIVLAVPSQAIREVCQTLKEELQHQEIAPIIVHVATGIERGTELRLSQVIEAVMPRETYRGIAVLSGPSHAEEVARRDLTSISAASEDLAVAEAVQQAFMNDYFRVYTNQDVLGVELGGALKNIIAVCAGIIAGLGYGDNAKAGLITRGLAEITRLGVKLGADPLTFSGLSGVGDLIVTCTSVHSRNWQAGNLLALGLNLEQVQQKIGMVIEGTVACQVARNLARSQGVEMPLTEMLYHYLYENPDFSIQEAVKQLMLREGKHETTYYD